jgi:hypothetical protein
VHIFLSLPLAPSSQENALVFPPQPSHLAFMPINQFINLLPPLPSNPTDLPFLLLLQTFDFNFMFFPLNLYFFFPLPIQLLTHPPGPLDHPLLKHQLLPLKAVPQLLRLLLKLTVPNLEAVDPRSVVLVELHL